MGHGWREVGHGWREVGHVMEGGGACDEHQGRG